MELDYSTQLPSGHFVFLSGSKSMQKAETEIAQAMNRLADEIHALRMELTPSLRKTEALQDQEAARKLRRINLKKKAAG